MVADQSRPAIDFGLELERMTPAARRLLSAIDFVLYPDRTPSQAGNELPLTFGGPL